MRLKSLELIGFKSFADRTVFEFGDDTLTCVVGPNGCGKSNVVDALRWVLGEQRPTSMRGKEMTDVIFKGCSGRPGMGFAECTVILDNSAGSLPEQGPEISICRRVFKSGEGEYVLDGQKVRLKDIREMLFDTGLGGRGYSVLEQGRIDAVLSANPIDRRRIFEEAAGISRYRQRKHETELRLARVQQDLARLDDVTGELRSRVRSLKIQAGKAERFVEARGVWQIEKTRLVKHQLFSLGGDLETCVAAVESMENDLAILREEREGAAGEIGKLETGRDEIQERVERAAACVAKLEGDARALDERRTQLLARVNIWEHAAADEEQRVQDLSTQLAQRAAELEVFGEQEQSLTAEVAASRTTTESQTQARRELNQSYAKARQRSQEQNEVVLAALHGKTAAENTRRHIEEARGPAEERFERVHSRLEEASGQLEGAQTEEHGARADLHGLQAVQAAGQARLAGLEGNLRTLDSEWTVIEASRNELALDVARHTSRIESLLDRERELENLGQGAKAVLEAASEAGGPCAAEQLSGFLGDHLHTTSVHARALDAVLGERSAALVAADASVARRVARWLSDSDHGQAALTIPGGLGSPPAPSFGPLSGELDGLVLAELRSEVRCDPGFEGHADALLGGVLLARDLEAALKIVARAPERRCVTPAGELVDAAGLVAGSRSLTGGAIGRRSSAAELQTELTGLEANLTDLAGASDKLKLRREDSRQGFEAAGVAMQEKMEAVAAGAGRLATAEARVRDLGAAVTLLQHESTSVVAEHEQLGRDSVVAAEEVLTCRETFETENEALKALDRTRHELEQRRELFLREESLARVEQTRLEGQLGGLTNRMADLKRTFLDNEHEAERAGRLSREASESAALGSKESHQLSEQCTRIGVERETADAELVRLRDEVGSVGSTLEENRQKCDSATRRLEGRASNLSDLRLDEQRIGLARAEVVRRAEEELELSPKELLEDFVQEEELAGAEAVTCLEARVNDLKGQLERLGPVNMEALGELEEVGGRLEFLEAQIEDLVQSRRVLNDTLGKIEVESERLFKDTFEEVRENFQRIFRQLFGGGKADVKLDEGLPVLEAGVEISARPPGREMLPIGLLSGGQRTMTALALLFAVFEARPSPFCVLDEVDAALDEANIQRFLAMLGEFRKKTQFVVVTHNKGTMTAGDSLYGVTMQTKGVSRQVSVQMDDVDELVPEARGSDKPAGEGPAAKDSPGPAAVDGESGERIVELTPRVSGEAETVTDSGADSAPKARAEPTAEPSPAAGN